MNLDGALHESSISNGGAPNRRVGHQTGDGDAAFGDYDFLAFVPHFIQ